MEPRPNSLFTYVGLAAASATAAKHRSILTKKETMPGCYGFPPAGIQVETPDPDNNRQPEAKPANPDLHGGRSLKQRRTGFFGLVGPPKAGTEEACFSLPGVR